MNNNLIKKIVLSGIGLVLIAFLVFVLWIIDRKTTNDELEATISNTTNTNSAVNVNTNTDTDNTENGTIDFPIEFTFPKYLQPNTYYPETHLESSESESHIKSVRWQSIPSDFVDINGGDAEYPKAISIEFAGQFKEIGTTSKTKYGNFEAFERVFLVQNETDDGDSFSRQYRYILLYNEVLDRYLSIEFEGQNTSAFETEVQLILSSAQSTTVDYGFEYTNELKNPYTGETYFVKKWPNESWCGVNGSGICDLVIKRGERYRFVVDLFFAETPKKPGALSGAELLSFVDADTLLIRFGSYDHGGGYSAIYTYNLKTEQLTEKLSFVTGDWSECDDIEYYKIAKGERAVVFVNCAIADYPQKGIYYVVNDSVVPLTTSLEPPFEIEFDVQNNYDKDKVTITINGTNHSFDFTSLNFQ